MNAVEPAEWSLSLYLRSAARRTEGSAPPESSASRDRSWPEQHLLRVRWFLFFFFFFYSENRKHNITHRGEVRSCRAAPHTNASQLNVRGGGGGLNCETHTALSLRLCWLGLERISAADLWWRHVNESQRESVQHIQLRAARPERENTSSPSRQRGHVFSCWRCHHITSAYIKVMHIKGLLIHFILIQSFCLFVRYEKYKQQPGAPPQFVHKGDQKGPLKIVLGDGDLIFKIIFNSCSTENK